jgi:membrane-bound lytic murein transglycosylase D
LLHKRANRWFPLIEPILKENGIPEDFKYIALIESQLTNVVSPQGATGFWQIVEPTGKQYGLEITEEVDERYDVVKSTRAACKYFKEAYKIFNNWTLVAASYNRGMGGVEAAMNKQKVDNYYDLLLTEETARYVYRLLAIKEIISRPKVYGYILRKKDLYPAIPTKKIQIDSSIGDLAAFAISQKINYKILKTFNPWLKTNTLTNPGNKKYTFEIPKNNTEIYDLDGNYEGSNILTVTDSINLALPTEFAKDTVAAEIKKQD